VKSTGDGLLATFSSAADAVGCTVGMQQTVDLHRRAAGVPLAVRAGVALGDVSFEEGDVYGTPVVEAARSSRLPKEARSGGNPTASTRPASPNPTRHRCSASAPGRTTAWAPR
jgi:hypothetical protein